MITTKEQRINNPQCTVEGIHPNTICVPQYPTRTPPIYTRDYISVSASFKPFLLNLGINSMVPKSLMAGGSLKTMNEVVWVTLERMNTALAKAQGIWYASKSKWLQQ